MPRARKARLSDDVRAQLFAEYGITDMQISVHDGVTMVKHGALGWMPRERWTMIQTAKGALPLIEKVIEGGYRTKAALWSLTAQVGPIAIPLGAYIPVKGLLLAQGAFAAGDNKGALQWLLAIVLPFGDLAILLQIVSELTSLVDQIKTTLTDPFGAVAGATQTTGTIGLASGNPIDIIAAYLKGLWPF